MIEKIRQLKQIQNFTPDFLPDRCEWYLIVTLELSEQGRHNCERAGVKRPFADTFSQVGFTRDVKTVSPRRT